MMTGRRPQRNILKWKCNTDGKNSMNIAKYVTMHTMKRLFTFIETHEFSKQWAILDCNDDDLRKLELELIANPKKGSVMQGTGRLRKMRFPLPNTGKSGGIRVCYVFFDMWDIIYFITVYPKSQKDNLSQKECNEIKKFIDILEKEIANKRWNYTTVSFLH